MSNEWLTNVKRGDAVIVCGRYGSTKYVQKVLRLTPTRIIVGTPSARLDGANTETAYRKTDGHQVGDSSFGSNSLMEGTPEAIQAVLDENRRIKLADQLGHRNWRNCSLKDLEAITAILSVKEPR
jgi:hypothetical protein